MNDALNQINEIKAFIEAGDQEKARALLREALHHEPDAEIYYLASLAAINNSQKVSFLKKALELDPFHEKASLELNRLELPEYNGPEEIPATNPPLQPLFVPVAVSNQSNNFTAQNAVFRPLAYPPQMAGSLKKKKHFPAWLGWILGGVILIGLIGVIIGATSQSHSYTASSSYTAPSRPTATPDITAYVPPVQCLSGSTVRKDTVYTQVCMLPKNPVINGNVYAVARLIVNGKPVPGINMTVDWNYSFLPRQSVEVTGSNGFGVATDNVGLLTSGTKVRVDVTFRYGGKTYTDSDTFIAK